MEIGYVIHIFKEKIIKFTIKYKLKEKQLKYNWLMQKKLNFCNLGKHTLNSNVIIAIITILMS